MFQGFRDLGVDLSYSYLFQIVTEDTRVLDQPVCYPVVYDRLRVYLRKLGVDMVRLHTVSGQVVLLRWLCRAQ